jgi:hypothetical protein
MSYEIVQTCMLVPDIDADSCASWVQAWGSICALAVAIGVGWYQARRSADSAAAAIKHGETLLELQRVDRVIEAFAAPIAILEAFVATGKDLHAECMIKAQNKVGPPGIPAPAGEGYVPRELVQRLEAIKAAFDVLPAHAVPGAPGVTLMLDLRDSTRRVMMVVNTLVTWLLTQWGPCPCGESLWNHINLVDEQLAKLSTEAVRIAQPPA